MSKQALALTLLAIAAHTQAADTEKMPPFWGGSAELGSIITSGNTETSSLNGKFGLSRKGINWDSHYRLEALTSKEDDTVSKETYYGAIQLDRNFSEHSYLALHADQERARFSGFTYQSTISVGYGYRAIDSDTTNLDLEAGPGYNRDKLENSDEIEEQGMLRLAMKYGWKISKTTHFTQIASAEMGDDNSTYKSETGLKSQINGSLATKLTYKIKYVEEVPDANKNMDKEFGVTLVYSF
ncbi:MULTISPECIES: YdiY family protein [unclassified Oceanobacter]|jgi:putative salt-induced outer membrane protein YdiY|uniref:DUF481 domain-containing protein n=1 Tax=unclassified Oceanobacter TaxID=2620260 RepID=UPI0026E191E6|nr:MULTISPECIES: DUF481 domain-containing protein [unclassified Oceanobacter]MDO6680947.1 DUF481 domain-containing protein [Oceanobacter sp. 5_MG-2023]MDP2504708.1 DUF481 domain-containing protein [Oceanobacter sp. 3_MG-2023]MDP2546834.1 DUF481 domain-containing protein [Oceanobacter sp. 4_MG-2023]MDP2607661.1 DUF481 domain-containing protein [Oceanobacter sp. 1_MG-2023]MDP2611155.1 DUF481 domain-containing protein [Oceanobacter sp. 2_MG-2023]